MRGVTRRLPVLIGLGAVCVVVVIGVLFLGHPQLRASPPTVTPTTFTDTSSIGMPADESTRSVPPPTIPARETSTTCGGIQAQTIKVSAEPEARPDPSSLTGKIEVVPAVASGVGSVASTQPVHVVVVGPPLGSMDSRDVTTDLTCTAQGIVLTATITRSADYHDNALKNAVFRPTVDVAVVLPQSTPTTFQAIWKMRLTTGSEVNRAQTPPYPAQLYPIALTTTIP